MKSPFIELAAVTVITMLLSACSSPSGSGGGGNAAPAPGPAREGQSEEVDPGFSADCKDLQNFALAASGERAENLARALLQFSTKLKPIDSESCLSSRLSIQCDPQTCVIAEK